jgi:hypothetical protein
MPSLDQRKHLFKPSVLEANALLRKEKIERLIKEKEEVAKTYPKDDDGPDDKPKE